MTKKDFTKFAELIATQKAKIQGRYSTAHNKEFFAGEMANLHEMKLTMIELFTDDNPNFDAGRFNAYIDKRVQEILAQG